ncbi:hypothetical protein BHE74_00032192 [Ensete ventricosum]|nr:hypothetical protein BHE74_00032192 [Ensete ventricosum]
MEIRGRDSKDLKGFEEMFSGSQSPCPGLQREVILRYLMGTVPSTGMALHGTLLSPCALAKVVVDMVLTLTWLVDALSRRDPRANVLALRLEERAEIEAFTF